MEFTLRIVDDSGDGIPYVEVEIQDADGLIFGIGPGQKWLSKTDENGWASFEIEMEGPLRIGHVSVSREFTTLADIECDVLVEDGDTESFTIS